ncbi:AsnC family transcriptional regulator [Rhodococcus sp. EPR-157]|uniref:Lrp/AsnC family transcriptional regulator n=1 Tax=Rhodococcus sp. EPR-157 TaxID=1813677 RepID=UPI0007BC0973|nr:Lrp/AsnC family transcriptional regulator [Rhodococcus sp. EPR-157]KZF10607.1 AsnC family transcriptional regulator [Rhodococcus sp. EPR-157]
MDSVDEHILGLLRENARCSFSELGRMVGLSTNATAARVRKLENEGVILGYTLLEGQSAGGPRGGLEVFIDVRLDPAIDYDTFTTRIELVRQVVEAIHMTGPYDYLLRAYVPDTGALDLLLRRLKSECGAAQTQTRVALRAR